MIHLGSLRDLLLREVHTLVWVVQPHPAWPWWPPCNNPTTLLLFMWTPTTAPPPPRRKHNTKPNARRVPCVLSGSVCARLSSPHPDLGCRFRSVVMGWLDIAFCAIRAARRFAGPRPITPQPPGRYNGGVMPWLTCWDQQRMHTVSFCSHPLALPPPCHLEMFL